MTILRPLSHNTTIEEYKIKLSRVMGEALLLNNTAYNQSSIYKIKANLQCVIQKNNIITDKITLDLEKVRKSKLPCHHLNHRREAALEEILVNCRRLEETTNEVSKQLLTSIAKYNKKDAQNIPSRFFSDR